MSDQSTTRMLEAYIEQRNAPKLFLTSFFRTPTQNFHSAEHVEIDIRRGEPVIAIPVQSVNAGSRRHEASKYTNKKYTPPVYDLVTPISAWSSSQRKPGEDPFQSPDFRRNAREEAFRSMGELELMIQRAVELQCSQIFQTGVVSLVDSSNTVVYTIDFEVKATHLATAGATWHVDGSTGDPLTDLEALGIIVRRDGKHNPTDLIFGVSAMQRFLANAKVKARLDNLGLQSLQQLAPSFAGQGATFYGTIVIGHYRYRLWMYDDYYIDPVSGNPTPFIHDEKVIMLAEGGRRDLTFGALPMFVPPEARAAQFLPTRMSSAQAGFDLTTNVWVSPDGKHLNLSAGTRPLAVPTAVDTFGVLDVTV
jgi:hypothetical protein